MWTGTAPMATKRASSGGLAKASSKRVRQHKTPFDSLNDDCLYTLFKYIVAADMRTALALFLAYPRLRQPFYANTLRNWIVYAVLEPLNAPIQYIPSTLSIVGLYELAQHILAHYPHAIDTDTSHYMNTEVDYFHHPGYLCINTSPFTRSNPPINGLRHLTHRDQRVTFPIPDPTLDSDPDTPMGQWFLDAPSGQKINVEHDSAMTSMICNHTDIAKFDIDSLNGHRTINTVAVQVDNLQFIPQWVIDARSSTVVLKCEDVIRQPNTLIGLHELLANATRISLRGAGDTKISNLLTCIPTTVVHLHVDPLCTDKGVDWSPLSRLTQLQTLYVYHYNPLPGKAIPVNTLTQLRAIKISSKNAQPQLDMAKQLASLPKLKAVYLTNDHLHSINPAVFPMELADIPKLQVLVAYGFNLPNNFASILQRAKKLRVLAVSNWQNKYNPIPDLWPHYAIEHAEIQSIHLNGHAWKRQDTLPPINIDMLRNNMDIAWDERTVKELRALGLLS